jgi:hypothetical protein
MRGAAWRISSPETTLTAAGVSSSESPDADGAALTTMVLLAAFAASAETGNIAGSISNEACRSKAIFIMKDRKKGVECTEWDINGAYVNRFIICLKSVNSMTDYY